MSDSSYEPHVHIDLDSGSLIAVPNEFETIVRCNDGVLWVTQLDNPDDLTIYPGESMKFGTGKNSIIVAATTASLEMCFPHDQRCQLMLHSYLNCHKLKYFARKQAVKVKGKCRIEFTKNAAEICLQ